MIVAKAHFAAVLLLTAGAAGDRQDWPKVVAAAEKSGVKRLVVECEKGWVFQGHENQEFAVVMKDGSSFEPPFLASAPSHYQDFVDKAVYGGRARSDFSWSASMSEALFWGNIAEKRPNERIVCA